MAGRSLVLISMLGCIFSACHQRRVVQTDALTMLTPQVGWHLYKKAGFPQIAYGFPDDPSMGFFARCDAGPVFALFGGHYSSDAKTAALETGGKLRKFKIYRGMHGGGILLTADVEVPDTPASFRQSRDLAIARDLASAKTPIVITTDDGWRTTIPEDPMIDPFVQGCVAYRSAERSRRPA